MRILTGIGLVLVLGFLVGSAQAADPRRVALVVGNAAYQSSPLNNSVNDARAMTDKLKKLGFEVIEKQNLKTQQIGATLREFRSRLQPGTEALFFYAGHGLQVKGVNYLPTVDAAISSEEEVPMQSINVNQVLEIMEEAKTRLNLIFLDACRNNPFSKRFRSSADGLAKVSAPSGTLISFATRPGSVAADGSGKNGLYTEQLLAAMDHSNLPIEQVLKNAAAGVKRASKGQQEPWSEGMIEGEFYFIFQAPMTVNAQIPVAAGGQDSESHFWNEVKGNGSREYYETYVKQYPKGKYVGLATVELKKLDDQAHQSRQQADKSAWDRAKVENSVSSYGSYLTSYPKGQYAGLAHTGQQQAQVEAAEKQKKVEEEKGEANYIEPAVTIIRNMFFPTY